MAKTVFVLGAGASKAGGCPLMGEFLAVAKDLWARNGPVVEDTDSFKLVFDTIGALQIVHSKARLDLANIEALFNALEMAKLLSVLPIPGRATDADQVIAALRVVIAATLEATGLFPYYQDGGLQPPVPYREFVELLDHLMRGATPTHTVALLTFNYDLGLDYALAKLGANSSYCLDAGVACQVPLLKLHGSLNWAVTGDDPPRILPWSMTDYTNTIARSIEGSGTGNIPLSPRKLFDRFARLNGTPIKEEPFIVPPAWNKADHHHSIKPVWERAAAELRDAENIIVMGYSLPETDGFFKSLYALGTIGKAPLQRFWLFDPDQSGVEKRFRNMLGTGAEAAFRHFPKRFDPEGFNMIRAEFPGR